MTPDDARSYARQLLVEVDKGRDPVGEMEAYRRSPTLSDLCDRFLDEHVEHRCKPTTQAEYKRMVNLFIKPRLGTRKVCDVKRPDIAKLHHEMHETPYQANHTLGVLSKAIQSGGSLGLASGRLESLPPCQKIPRN